MQNTPQPQQSRKKHWLLTIIVLALVGLVFWKLHTAHFDWAAFWHACRRADWRLLLAATLVIWANCIFRAARWAIFLRPSLPPEQHVTTMQLLGSQYIGFTGLAIFGRIGELIRPYLIARRTGLTLASQIAAVAVERIFDLGAFALIFTLNLLLAPGLDTLPFHEKFHIMGYALAAMTLVIGVFIASVWYVGAPVASLFRRFIGLVSKPAGEAAEAKVLSFREGLNTISSRRDFVSVSVLSVFLWLTIALAYILVMKAFPAPVSTLSVSSVVLLMGFSVVGSVVQLPGIGGGAQALTIGALSRLFSIPLELAFSSGLILWAITTMSIIPVGLVYSRIEHVSLGKVTRESEAAGETSQLSTTA